MDKKLQYIEWLKDYFRKKSQELPQDIEAINFFVAGLIDSLEVIILIEEIEKEFSIKFTQDDFQDGRFPTVLGLAEIISELKR